MHGQDLAPSLIAAEDVNLDSFSTTAAQVEAAYKISKAVIMFNSII